MKATVIFPVSFQFDHTTFNLSEQEWSGLSVEAKQERIKAHAESLKASVPVEPVIHECDDDELIE